MLSGISLAPLMGKALMMVLEVLSNALLVMQISGLRKNQLILCQRCLSTAEKIPMPLNLYFFIATKQGYIVDYGLEERCLTWSKVLGTRSFYWYKSCSKT